MPAPYPHSSIVNRPPLTFPDGKRVAFYIGLNVEVFDADLPVVAGGPVPDPQAYGWRDYGNRVGFWRLVDVLDDAGVPVSVILNSEAARAFPEIVDAGVERGWAWVAHGRTNSVYLSGMDGAKEAAHLDAVFADLDAALLSRPTGWLGPGLAATAATPHLLAERGVRYVLDWCCDDQPFAMDVPGLWSVPYSLELNDLNLFLPGPGPSGPDYERLVLDQFEQLLADSATTGRVLALPLHTFIAGQPHRAKYVARVIRQIAATPEVWVCTSDDVAAHARQAAHGPAP
ncbi:polysaccharide deacetylase family protein [Pseudonocardia endophytica]|uniref:Polysaccharide deacetylase n=1 Tax=Pseudonocardia endophytica TaxID=401976 RepID=A0A4R1HWY5_PSEEN|nr:polysaccharide deacetylase family protein [Pseudonocardia endophytica]TCK26003.1 polysaccharide deacetylase [Pseudonocardia endophytica]